MSAFNISIFLILTMSGDNVTYFFNCTTVISYEIEDNCEDNCDDSYVYTMTYKNQFRIVVHGTNIPMNNWEAYFTEYIQNNDRYKLAIGVDSIIKKFTIDDAYYSVNNGAICILPRIDMSKCITLNPINL